MRLGIPAAQESHEGGDGGRGGGHRSKQAPRSGRLLGWPRGAVGCSAAFARRALARRCGGRAAAARTAATRRRRRRRPCRRALAERDRPPPPPADVFAGACRGAGAARLAFRPARPAPARAPPAAARLRCCAPCARARAPRESRRYVVPVRAEFSDARGGRARCAGRLRAAGLSARSPSSSPQSSPPRAGEEPLAVAMAPRSEGLVPEGSRIKVTLKDGKVRPSRGRAARMRAPTLRARRARAPACEARQARDSGMRPGRCLARCSWRRHRFSPGRRCARKVAPTVDSPPPRTRRAPGRPLGGMQRESSGGERGERRKGAARKTGGEERRVDGSRGGCRVPRSRRRPPRALPCRVVGERPIPASCDARRSAPRPWADLGSCPRSSCRCWSAWWNTAARRA